MQPALNMSAFHPLIQANLCQSITTFNATRDQARRRFIA
jgi:hypothetical protein